MPPELRTRSPGRVGQEDDSAILDTLREELESKELLIREVNHRVKNTLQLAISLLQLQARHLPAGNQQIRAAIDEICARLHVLSRVHELLYRQAHLGEDIDFGVLLRELTEKVAASFVQKGQDIGLIVEAIHLRFNPDEAIPCALIALEAVTNAYKHAFPDGRAGVIRVQLKARANQALLRIADNGIGIGRTTTKAGYGTHLIQSLAAQAGGTCRIRSQAGTIIQVTLPFRIRPVPGGSAAPNRTD